MIAWRVDAGYFIGDDQSLDSFNVLDTDKYFSLATLPTGNPLPEGENEKYISFNTYSELYSYASEFYGIQINQIYGGGFINGRLPSIEILNAYFPSFSTMFPNTFSYINENRGATVALHFKTLKKILIYYGSTSLRYTKLVSESGVDIGSTGVNLIAFELTGFTNESATATWKISAPVLYNYKGGEVDASQIGLVIMNLISTGKARMDFAKNYSTSYHTTYNLFSGAKPDYIYLPDPYLPGGTSSEGDYPPGTFDDNSDPIPIPPIPTLSASDTGFTRIYNPTLSQVQDLARYLWTEPSLLETLWNHIKQFFEDPMDAMIGFNLVPVQVPDGGTTEFKVMYIGTGVQMTAAASQFVDVDCGSVQLDRYYGSALDQSPYTKVNCFLPYIGMVQLNTDEVMGTTLSITYRVDIVSGSCVAYILVDGNALYQYSGHCAITIPFSSADFSNYVSAAIQVAKMIGMVSGSAISAALPTSNDPSQGTNQVTRTVTETTTARNPNTGRQITTGTKTWSETKEGGQESTKASFAGLTPQNVANTVSQVMSAKLQIPHSGSFSGTSGYLGVRRPYLVIERPNMCLPANYQALNGYPSMITMELGTCTGFTRVQQVQLTGLWATEPEQSEILQLLKTGVIF